MCVHTYNYLFLSLVSDLLVNEIYSLYFPLVRRDDSSYL